VQTVVAGFPGAGTVRLEVLKENAAAIAWYLRQGFEIYGETGNATGMAGVPSLYMDKQLVAQSR
jgi:ribosomal protein S18 acetylase RimI-like enzyme